MRFSRLTSFFIILACSALWLGNKDGRANGGNEGATGAPNDNPTNRTCQNCHNGSSSIQVTLDIEFINSEEQLVSSYLPGETYSVKVRVNSVGNTAPSKHGFQMVALSEGLTPINNWSNPGSGIQTTTLSNGRTYVEHLTPSVSNTFEVSWTAPAEGTGDITFYSCGNGVNGNDDDSGDSAAKTQLTITEGSGSVSAKDVPDEPSFDLFPVPATEMIYLDLPASLSGNVQISILDLSGRAITSAKYVIQENERQAINISALPLGLYFIRVQTPERSLSKQFVKH
ncbi:MAG: T9SS type A sorting domain-containing protein [Saprospiraceae bacterium]|nr:T9SS type A sorting domain-containing protein [Saprospiraceae bacterium]